MGKQAWLDKLESGKRRDGYACECDVTFIDARCNSAVVRTHNRLLIHPTHSTHSTHSNSFPNGMHTPTNGEGEGEGGRGGGGGGGGIGEPSYSCCDLVQVIQWDLDAELIICLREYGSAFRIKEGAL